MLPAQHCIVNRCGPVTQRWALKRILCVTDVSIDPRFGDLRVSGSLDSGAERLVSALRDAGYPAKLSGCGRIDACRRRTGCPIRRTVGAAAAAAAAELL
jgi:hypothetical protein